ncbi:MAG TPA: SIS domain-containing protein [Candidatus Dormibacteraeota bacterium]|jgi:glucosamine--fructose-6-phosphate aminotransferase (isomerizing)|nr:SIS domain-containing protein [Candidatus Dormibacteraeota bacterium]
MSQFLTEIRQQPEVARRILDSALERVQFVADAIRAAGVKGLILAARGSSDHGATYGRFLFEVRNKLAVSLASPSVYTHYQSPPVLEGFGVMGISQSGSSPDVVAVIKEARRQGALTIALTNQPASDLSAAAEHVLPMGAGPELSVPASKTYTATLLVLALLSSGLDPDPAFTQALHEVPEALAMTLELEPRIADWAPLLAENRMLILGRGYHFATAQEIALKLTETSYLWTQANSVADFLHGPVSVVEPGLASLLVDANGPAQGDLRNLARTLGDRGARVMRMTDGEGEWPGVESVLRIQTGLPEPLTPIPFAVAGQLLAYHRARSLGFDPDHPRQLTKVTRTW